MKSVQISSFFWSEYGKIRTGKKSVFGHLSRSHIGPSELAGRIETEVKMSSLLYDCNLQSDVT